MSNTVIPKSNFQKKSEIEDNLPVRCEYCLCMPCLAIWLFFENCLKCCFINTCRILTCDFCDNKQDVPLKDNKIKHRIIDVKDNNINEEKNNETSQNILKLVDYESLDKDNKEAFNVWKNEGPDASAEFMTEGIRNGTMTYSEMRAKFG